MHVCIQRLRVGRGGVVRRGDGDKHMRFVYVKIDIDRYRRAYVCVCFNACYDFGSGEAALLGEAMATNTCVLYRSIDR